MIMKQNDHSALTWRYKLVTSTLLRFDSLQSQTQLGLSSLGSPWGTMLRVSASLQMHRAAYSASCLSQRSFSPLLARNSSLEQCSLSTWAIKCCSCWQKRAVRGALWESSGNLRLTALMTLMSLWRMKSRYSFSQVSERWVKVAQSSWCSLHCWYSSQWLSRKWFSPLSHSSRTTFSSSLNSVSISTLLCSSYSSKLSQFWIAPCSSSTQTSSLNCSSLLTSMGLGLPLSLLPRTDMPDLFDPVRSSACFDSRGSSLELESDFCFDSESWVVPDRLRSLMDSVEELSERVSWPRGACPNSNPISQSFPMRLASLVRHARLTKSASLVLRTGLGRMTSLPMLSSSSFSVSASLGVSPTSISQSSIPMEQMSDLQLQQLFLRLYGAMQRGVPTFMRSLKPKRDRTAKPKSDIFQRLPMRSTLAGLMSRWTTPWSSRWRQAASSWLTISIALVQVSCFFWVMYSRRLPWGQYSITRQQEWGVLTTSSSRTMLGCSKLL